MSSAKSHETLSRQWELLKAIPLRGQGKTAAELTQALTDQGFQITKRTVERDLNDLSLVFPLLTDDSCSPQRWGWIDDKDLHLPGMSVVEAVMLQLVEGTLQQVLPVEMLQGLSGRFHQARRKLQALEQSNQNARLMDKIAVVSPGLPMQPPKTSPDLYEAVQQALTEKYQLHARYTSVYHQQQKDFLLNPLGLVQRGHVTYLVATVAPYTDVRLFALHRFELLQLEPSALLAPDGFSLEAYLKSGALQFANDKLIELHARIRPELARLLIEAPLSKDMKLVHATDSWQTLTASVQHGWQLEWWILSHSSQIEVVAPAELRERIVARLRATIVLYPELQG